MIDHASTDRHAAHRMPDDDGVGQVEVFENLDEIAPAASRVTPSTPTSEPP